jgi:hypothetical protein
MSFIKDKFSSKRDYEIIYPKYKIKSSNYPHFPGYVVILMGLKREDIIIPNQLFENYNVTNII